MMLNLVLAGMAGLLLSPFLALPVMLLCQRVFPEHRNAARLTDKEGVPSGSDDLPERRG